MTEDPALDDASLIRRCADGDESAWTEFVDRTQPLLTALARRRLERHGGRARPEDIDEVVAEVYLALLRRDRLLLERYDPRWRVSTYLGVICRTAVARLQRRRQRSDVTLEHPADVAEPDSDADGPLAGLTASEGARVRAILRGAMATLGRRDRLLLQLRFLHDLDYRAIGEALGVRPGSVGPLLRRAKQRLAARVPDLRRLLEEG